MKANFFLKIHILILVPSFLWIACGIILCVISYNKWYYYTAVIIPPAFVLISFLISNVFKLFGGILLLVNGLFFTLLALKNLTIVESLIMICLFIFPIMISGLLLVLAPLKQHGHYPKSQYNVLKY